MKTLTEVWKKSFMQLSFNKYFFNVFWKATDCFKDVIKSRNILNCHEMTPLKTINSNNRN